MNRFPATDDRLPAYARLRDALTARIAGGEWPAGARLPSEAQLAQAYRLSVGTVRKAVDGLVRERLLERRQGYGTCVRAPSFDANLFRFFQLRETDGSPLPIPSSQLILRSLATAPREAAAALGVRKVVKIVRLRRLADEPVLFEEIYLPAARFRGLAEWPADRFGPLLYPLYFERFGILVKRATDDLSFAASDAAVARPLRLNAGDPLVVIRRTALDIGDKPVEWRIARGSAARFRYRSHIS